jgi:hypothetical protein
MPLGNRLLIDTEMRRQAGRLSALSALDCALQDVPSLVPTDAQIRAAPRMSVSFRTSMANRSNKVRRARASAHDRRRGRRHGLGTSRSAAALQVDHELGSGSVLNLPPARAGRDDFEKSEGRGACASRGRTAGCRSSTRGGRFDADPSWEVSMTRWTVLTIAAVTNVIAVALVAAWWWGGGPNTAKTLALAGTVVIATVSLVMLFVVFRSARPIVHESVGSGGRTASNTASGISPPAICGSTSRSRSGALPAGAEEPQ